MMTSLLKDLAEIGMAIGSNDIKVLMLIHSNVGLLFYISLAGSLLTSITSPNKHFLTVKSVKTKSTL